jgi:hypothetical protein
MIDKKDIKKFARELVKFDKGIKNPKLMHPSRDWQIGILSGVVLLSGVTLWNLDTYFEYREDNSISQTEEVTDSVVYRETLVKSALDSYQERALTHQELRSGEPAPFPETVPEEIDQATSTTLDIPAEDQPIDTATTSELSETPEDTPDAPIQPGLESFAAPQLE